MDSTPIQKPDGWDEMVQNAFSLDYHNVPNRGRYGLVGTIQLILTLIGVAGKQKTPKRVTPQ